tara:strand:+ start:198 stop:425 length:228 start_codon:yes stop_codon:yes gene_type:complete
MRRTNNNYRKVIRQTLLEMYKRIDVLLYSVPIGSNLDEDEDAANAVLNIRAIESEWILDKDLLEKVSVIVVNPNS